MLVYVSMQGISFKCHVLLLNCNLLTGPLSLFDVLLTVHPSILVINQHNSQILVL